MPDVLNGVPLTPWTEPPGLWASLPAQVREPPRPPRMAVAAGTVVVEPDGRVWLVAPTNGYSGYRATFPKGRVEGGLSLQACALKETFEETGLWVELLCHLVDLPRSKGFARYYLARRRSGTPAAMGWESQAVLLVPPGALGELLNKDRDLTIAEALRKRLPAGWATGKVELGR